MAPVQDTPTATGAQPARHARDTQLAALLTDAARGNGQAFERFFDSTAGHARALARRFVRGADLDDLLADVYFEAWRKAALFDAGRGSAVTWLLQIVRSRALDLLRHQASHATVAWEEGDGVHAAQACNGSAHVDEQDPATRLWQLQAGTRLHAAMAQLSAAERWVLGLAYFRGLSHGEIAATTALPLGTVKSHVQRAQTKLRAALAE
jgi:RNA polymerase sigma-70 factor, ECF subfamily